MTESRFARHRRIVAELWSEPHKIGGFLRQVFVALWVRHGAGFYGLGWVITFIILEFDMFTGDIVESEGVGDFVSSQLAEYVLRIGFMAFINTLLAAIWPVYVLQWFDGWGIVALVAGYFAFEKLLRPLVEFQFPELAVAREERQAQKDAKETAKQAQKEKKKEKKEKT